MTPDELIALLDTASDAPGADAVAAFEHSLGFTLPDDYRRFLASMRGGSPGRTVTFPVGIDRDYLARVHGLGGKGRCDIEGAYAEDGEDAALPGGLLRIMDNRGGDAIAMAVRTDRLGEVFLIDHEVADDEGPPSLEDAESDDWGLAIALAPSFTAFVDGLAIKPD